MNFKEFLKEKENKKIIKTRKKSRIIPDDIVMKEFKKILKKHKYVFDYLKDKWWYYLKK